MSEQDVSRHVEEMERMIASAAAQWLELARTRVAQWIAPWLDEGW